MPPLAVAATVVGAVATVVGTVQSAKAQRKSLRLQKQQQQVQTRRSRRQAIREMQVRRASAMASAQGSGTMGGSGAIGGIGGLSSQLGESLGFSSQMSGLSNQINQQEQKAVTGQSIASLGGFAFNAGASAGGLDFLKKKT